MYSNLYNGKKHYHIKGKMYCMYYCTPNYSACTFCAFFRGKQTNTQCTQLQIFNFNHWSHVKIHIVSSLLSSSHFAKRDVLGNTACLQNATTGN